MPRAHISSIAVPHTSIRMYPLMSIFCQTTRTCRLLLINRTMSMVCGHCQVINSHCMCISEPNELSLSGLLGLCADISRSKLYTKQKIYFGQSKSISHSLSIFLQVTQYAYLYFLKNCVNSEMLPCVTMEW